MNCYATLAQVKAALNQTGTDNDAYLLTAIGAASRAVDAVAGREFFTVSETRYFDSGTPGRVIIDDLLSASAVATDVDGDRSYGEVWGEADYELYPANDYPKTIIAATPTGAFLFAYHRRLYVSVTGVFGHGDGTSSNPWLLTSDVMTLDDATSTTATFTGHTSSVAAGHTILLDSEQLFVSSVTTGETNDTATVTRAVNGTTGTAHASATASIAKYPDIVTQAVTWYTSMLWNQAVSAGYSQQRIGEYSYQIASASSVNDALVRYLGGVTRRSAY